MFIEWDSPLSDEERQVRETIHRFAEEVMRPVGQRLDKLADPADVIAPGSELWDVFRRHDDLGLDEISASPDLTPLQQARMRCIISEEQGWGDAGLSISFGVHGFPRMAATLTGREDLIERFSGEGQVGCWCATEPDHGSDFIMQGDRVGEWAKAPNVIARKEGDEFVINGQKSAWVSNGTIATATSLFCAVDMGDGELGVGSFLVPLDVPGVTKGKPLDKIGQRALNQGEIFFDGVRIPESYMIVPPEVMGIGMDVVLSNANSGMGSTFSGLARAALELAIDYAKDRVQGGAPIIEHQSVKARLFDMYRRVEAATALSRRAIVSLALNGPRLELAVASKTFATQTAFDVASAALQIFGGNGLTREYPIEKILRDARASMIEDGCNEVLSIVAADKL
ncbi:MAG: acyl-CoA/acyl-ACP dehydrogenase [Acidimicrobiia bacterium]|nr:acyl-CoA/acyl-ACP dehydrogenase [Acidimicrobiia bacterium]